jgi:Holliday junction resolvase RusA-like endonuclease
MTTDRIDTRPPDDLEILSQRSFFVPGHPVGKGSVRVQFRARGKNGKPGKILDKPRTHYHPKTKKYMKLVASSYRKQCRKLPMIEGPFRVSMFAFYQRPKYHFGTGRNRDRIKPRYLLAVPTVTPDLSNIWKGCEDPLSGVAYKDDKDRISGVDEKRYAMDPKNIGVFFVIEEVRLKED